MNDIEVLERLLKRCNECKLSECINCEISWNEVQVIENLLKERQSDKERIKDLEEINEAHKKENGELREIVEKQQSLIKEKIEELEFAIAFCGNEDRMKRLILQKEVLEELLKGE